MNTLTNAPSRRFVKLKPRCNGCVDASVPVGVVVIVIMNLISFHSPPRWSGPIRDGMKAAVHFSAREGQAKARRAAERRQKGQAQAARQARGREEIKVRIRIKTTPPGTRAETHARRPAKPPGSPFRSPGGGMALT
jgi:hypothetical protein